MSQDGPLTIANSLHGSLLNKPSYVASSLLKRVILDMPRQEGAQIPYIDDSNLTTRLTAMRNIPKNNLLEYLQSVVKLALQYKFSDNAAEKVTLLVLKNNPDRFKTDVVDVDSPYASDAEADGSARAGVSSLARKYQATKPKKAEASVHVDSEDDEKDGEVEEDDKSIEQLDEAIAETREEISDMIKKLAEKNEFLRDLLKTKAHKQGRRAKASSGAGRARGASAPVRGKRPAPGGRGGGVKRARS